MEQGWVAWLFIAFGVLVAVFGVVAYLRMIAASKRGDDVEFLMPADPELPLSGETNRFKADKDENGN